MDRIVEDARILEREHTLNHSLREMHLYASRFQRETAMIAVSSLEVQLAKEQRGWHIIREHSRGVKG